MWLKNKIAKIRKWREDAPARRQLRGTEMQGSGYPAVPRIQKEMQQAFEEHKGEISDGYHTFNELYDFRLLYNAALFNEWYKKGLYKVHKSQRHEDGEYCFGDPNWFIVIAVLPTGQISNHYRMKDWDLFKIPAHSRARVPYDGHTAQDVRDRLRRFLNR